MPTTRTTATASSRTQLPEIAPELRAALEKDLMARGILVPIIVAEDGTILDGRVRAEIAAKHRLPLAKIVVKLPPRERDGLRITLNTLRRHLTRDQVRELLAWEIRRTPESSDRAIAGRVGVSPTTVGKVRASTSTVHDGQLRIGRDGKVRRLPVVITTCEQQAREASRILSNLEDVPDGRVSVRRLRTLEYEENRKKAAEGPQGRLPASVTIRQGDFRTFDWSPWEGRAAMVCCDPPWLDQHADLRVPLAQLVARLLRQGGIAAIYCGTYGLPGWVQAFSAVTDLRYVWTIASVNKKDGKVRVHGRGRIPIQSSWRPILLYSRGDFHGKNVLYDIMESFGAEKTHHEWQQPLHEARKLIETLTKPGESDLIIDPCCGSGTTLLGVLQAGGGRVGVGIDLDGQAVRIARKRVGEFRNESNTST